MGLGVLSKYSIAFPVVSLVSGLVLLPSQRRHLRSWWFWGGVVLASLIAAPNLIWLFQHGAITLRMEQFIHARDVRMGRAAGYWTDQLRFTLLGLPLACLGLLWLLRSRQFQLLSVFFLSPLIELALARGRGYYLLPGYTVLYAAAAVALERWLRSRSRRRRTVWVTAVVLALGTDLAAMGFLFLPVFKPNSAPWTWQMRHNEDLANEIGWKEFVAEVAQVRERLPAAERSHLAVLAGNYGEAGALELYGPQFSLPVPISTVNSFHQRGWGPYEPETVIVTGSTLREQQRSFADCTVAGTVVLPFGVQNEETEDHPQILVCHRLKGSWPVVWARTQDFG